MEQDKLQEQVAVSQIAVRVLELPKCKAVVDYEEAIELAVSIAYDIWDGVLAQQCNRNAKQHQAMLRLSAKG